jgi:hypothetical protein
MSSLNNEPPKSLEQRDSPFAAFLTRERANAGIVLDLVGPQGPTGQTITIYGADSDVFREAKRRSENRLADLVTKRKNGTLSKVDLQAERLELLSALVKGWTLPELATKENVIAFLRKAPRMAEQIDTIAGDRSLLPV